MTMFPDHPDPPHLSADTIRRGISTPKPDNSAYIAAMRDFRQRYLDAAKSGPVEIVSVEFRKI